MRSARAGAILRPMNYSDPKLWFSAEGRVNRRPFFFAGLAAGALSYAEQLVPAEFKLIYMPVLLASIYMSIVLGIKRSHDRNRTGWFVVLNFIPILFLWPMIELTFFKGTDGPNQYGPDPLAPPSPSGNPVDAGFR